MSNQPSSPPLSSNSLTMPGPDFDLMERHLMGLADELMKLQYMPTNAALEAKMESLEKKIAKRFDRLEQRLNEVNARFDAIETKMAAERASRNA